MRRACHDLKSIIEKWCPVYNGCLAVAGETVLEEPSELGVAVGHVVKRLGEAGDDMAEAGERGVDLLRLLKRIANSPSLCHLLAPSQVHEVQLGVQLADTVGQKHHQKQMTPRRVLVGLRSCHVPVALRESDKLICLNPAVHSLYLLY